jgi:membrane fusion protein, multidrug efflux system
MNRFAGVVVLAALTSACSRPTTTEEVPLTRVRVATAALGPAAPVLRTSGVLVTKDEVRLSFKVAGVIKRIAVQEGQAVRRGQILAELAQGEIAAQVAQAQQALEKAQRDVARGEKLYQDRLVSLGQLQDLRTQAATGQAALELAQFNRNYAVIIAAEDGVILRRLARERELVEGGAPVLVMGVRGLGYVVRVGLADREVVQVRLGDEGEVLLDAYPGQVFKAQVTEIAAAADERSSLFQVELLIDAADTPLVSGLVANLALTPYSALQAQRVYVPLSAVVEGQGQRASVYLLGKDPAGHSVVRRREVQIAFIDGERVAIAAGLLEGEQVITDGALYVSDNERVELLSGLGRAVLSKE